MKKLLFIVIAAIAFTTGVHAQDSSANKRQKMHHAARMHRTHVFDELNLTQEQKNKLQEMKKESVSKMEAIKNNSSYTDAQKQEKMKDLRAEQRRNLEAVLTDDQKTKMKQMRAEHMKNMRHPKGASSNTQGK